MSRTGAGVWVSFWRLIVWASPLGCRRASGSCLPGIAGESELVLLVSVRPSEWYAPYCVVGFLPGGAIPVPVQGEWMRNAGLEELSQNCENVEIGRPVAQPSPEKRRAYENGRSR